MMREKWGKLSFEQRKMLFLQKRALTFDRMIYNDVACERRKTLFRMQCNSRAPYPQPIEDFALLRKMSYPFVVQLCRPLQ
jgi:hypothetical protein